MVTFLVILALVVGVYLAVASLIGGGFPHHPHFAPSLAKRIAKLLVDQPESWSRATSGFKLVHTSGIAIWTANGRGGVHVELPGGREFWSRVTLLGSPAQNCIWNAYLRWQDRADIDIDAILQGRV